MSANPTRGIAFVLRWTKDKIMTTTLHTISKPTAKETRPTSLWVEMEFANKEHVARIYADKILVSSPYVRWFSQHHKIDCRKSAIRNQKVIDAVLADIADGCEDSAWDRIFLAMTSCGIADYALDR